MKNNILNYKRDDTDSSDSKSKTNDKNDTESNESIEYKDSKADLNSGNLNNNKARYHIDENFEKNLLLFELKK